MLRQASVADSAHDAFSIMLLDVVRRGASTARSFAELIAGLPGVHPQDAIVVLRMLSAEDSGGQISRLVADSGVDREDKYLDQWAQLPLPHPLDSEFRFTTECANELAKELIAATRDGEELLLVGTPSVALALARSDADRVIRFIGPRDSVLDAVEAAFRGKRFVVGSGLPATASAAVTDPPWYEEAARPMVGACAHALKPGALLLVAVPLDGTRPGADADRARLADYVESLGFRPAPVIGEVRYRTPLFELAALEQFGIARLGAWRRGALMRWRLARARDLDRGAQKLPKAVELTLAGVRLRLLQEASASGPTLRPISSSEVFPSVSSRAPGRGKATLWTSGNRAFSADPEALRCAMAHIAAREGLLLLPRLTGPIKDSFRLDTIAAESALIHQLDELVVRETRDACRLVGDGAWLKTARGWRC